MRREEPGWQDSWFRHGCLTASIILLPEADPLPMMRLKVVSGDRDAPIDRDENLNSMLIKIVTNLHVGSGSAVVSLLRNDRSEYIAMGD